MADDIVTRLRQLNAQMGTFGNMGELCYFAADEIERLRRWKTEAMIVIEDWEAVFNSLIDPKASDLGKSKSVLVAKEIIRLRCDNGELRTRIEDMEKARRG